LLLAETLAGKLQVLLRTYRKFWVLFGWFLVGWLVGCGLVWFGLVFERGSHYVAQLALLLLPLTLEYWNYSCAPLCPALVGRFLTLIFF
jgi:uncharacterized SAM-binding protein YcdF (DUF218 family)